MRELFNAAFSAVNIIPTILMLLILIYWLTVIIGALDLDFLNVDVDTDADVDVDVDADIDVDLDADVDADMEADIDVDADADADTEISTEGAIISLNSVLGFFNLGKVPFMLLLTFFILPFFMISILANHFLNNNSILLSLVYLIPNFIASLLISKVLTQPFAAIYTRMGKNSDDTFRYDGKVCKIILSASQERVGQAEVHHNGDTHRINILATEGNSLEKGKDGLIINYIKDKNCYLVEPYKN